MLRKLFWVGVVLTTWALILAAREHRRERLEAELWAAATDPVV